MNDKNLHNKPIIRINPALIPEAEAKLLAITFMKGIRRFYSESENVAKFKKWQKQRQQEQQNSN